jgi:hypothetical protein
VVIPEEKSSALEGQNGVQDTSTPHGSIGTADVVALWCQQHNLGDEEAQCLRKLGFKVSDDLDALDDEMWKFAGALPLCHMRILRANRSGKIVGGAPQSPVQV